MSATGQYPSQVNFLPLRDAVLCADCHFVSGNELGMCPVCRGHRLVRLSGVLRFQEDSPTGWRKILQQLGFRRRLRGRPLNYAAREL